MKMSEVTTESKMVESEDGSKEWFDEEGELHREDGPAREYPDGSKYYFYHGKRHRLDGPASVDCFGYREYFIDGKQCQERRFEEKVKDFLNK